MWWNGEQQHTEQHSTGQAVEHDVTACWLAGWLTVVPQQADACSVWVMLRLEWVVCEFVRRLRD